MNFVILIICSLFVVAITIVYSYDELYGDEVKAVIELLNSLYVASCHPGYHTVSSEGRDIAYHCAGLGRKNPESKIIFLDENTVNFKGNHSDVNMALCFLKNLKLIKADGTGFDENKLDSRMKNWFSNPGGQATVKSIQIELMQCEKTHSVKFPEKYDDGTANKPWVDCVKLALVDVNLDDILTCWNSSP